MPICPVLRRLCAGSMPTMFQIGQDIGSFENRPP
jgi:hypothetical protein